MTSFFLILSIALTIVAFCQSAEIRELELRIDNYARAERHRKKFAEFLRGYKYRKNNMVHMPEDMFDLIVKKMEGES